MRFGILFAEDLDGLHARILEHRADLVLAADHGGGFGNIALEVDRVEHAASGAQAAADAAVGIHDAHAAAQAAAGLRLDLLFGKGKPVMLKGPRLLRIVQNRLTGRTVEADRKSVV